jgi:flagellar biogenesis protein FliO
MKQLFHSFFALGFAPAALAQTTNAFTFHNDLPNLGASAVRALGALAIVLAIFFAGVWLFRNGQRMAWRRSGAPQLALLESRSLGSRYTLHLIGYHQQRFLVGSSPAGLSLLSQLPPEPAAVPSVAESPEPLSFAQHLQQLLKGNSVKVGGPQG